MDTSTICIFIASHISNGKRIVYLEECLESLITQTIPVTIFLSISFETLELRREFSKKTQNDRIKVKIREEKTPQMRHMEKLLKELNKEYTWILFCDDDDRYIPTRVQRFCEYIAGGLHQLPKEYTLTGLYESTFGKDHREHRHEYWCYCVKRDIMERFMELLEGWSRVLEDKCCDVLFAEYLRRSRQEYVFIQIVEDMYKYRVDENEDSITGYIKTNQAKYTQEQSPPETTDDRWADYVLDWNEYLHENINVFVHDTYLRTVVGVKFEETLKAEFRGNYGLLEYVDKEHVEKMRKCYEEVSKVCSLIYDIRIVE